LLSNSAPRSAWEPAPVRPFDRVDLYFALAFFVLSWLIAALYLPTFRSAGGTPQFYQEDFAPAVMWACGRGYVNVDASAVPPLDAFLTRKVDVFRCDDLPAQLKPTALGLMPTVCRNLMLATGGVWRIAGVSWGAVDLLLSAMFATAITAAFVALRFVAGRTLSTIGALVWAISPMHLTNLPHLRDYSKAPYFALAAVAIGLVATRRRAAWLVATGVVFGVVEGIGFGMRTDVVLNLVPFLIAVFATGPRPARDQIGTKIATAIATLVAFVFVANPLFGIYDSSGGLTQIALHGLTSDFDRPLSIRPAPYDFGRLYDDSYVTSIVDGDWQRRHPGSTTDALVGSPFAAAARSYAFRLVLSFPGDMVTRATGSLLQTLNLPFTIAYGSAPLGVMNRVLVAVFRIRSTLMLALIGTGPLTAALLIVLLGCSRLRDGLVASAVLLFVGTYPVIQFNGRHNFHLEFLVIGVFIWLISLLVRGGRAVAARRIPPAQAVMRAAAAAAVVAIVWIVLMFITRALQIPGARALFASYENARTESVRLTETARGAGTVRLSADAFTSPVRGRLQQALFAADVMSGSCAQMPEHLTVRYLDDGNRAPVEYDFSTEVMLPATSDRTRSTRVFFPAYDIVRPDGGHVRFAAIDVPESGVECVRLSRVDGLERDLWLDATLTPDWRDLPLYQRLYIAPLFPERVWLRIAHWWPSLAALG
jgi:hypothetical protein